MSVYTKLSPYIGLACGFHCMMMPLAIAFIPGLAMFWIKGVVELTLIGTAIIATMIPLCWGFTKHYNYIPMALLAAGVWMIIGMKHTSCVLPILGGLCFVFSNLLNRKLCNSCVKCNHA